MATLTPCFRATLLQSHLAFAQTTLTDLSRDMQPAYEWVTELVHPVRGLHSLREVEIVEDLHSLARHVMVWRVPPRLVDAFRVAGVDFRLQLRARVRRQ